ncbi:hypothetical protein, partial [Nocardioides massiliensis]
MHALLSSLPRRARLVTGIVTVGAVLATTVLLATTGPPSPEAPAQEPRDLEPVAVTGPIAPADSCEALLRAYVAAALPEVTAWGLGGGWGRFPVAAG